MKEAKEKAVELVDKYQKTRLDILTKMDSVPCILSDFPTHQTAKMLAILEVNGILASFEMFMDQRKHFRHPLEIEAEKLWIQVKEEIEYAL